MPTPTLQNLQDEYNKLEGRNEVFRRMVILERIPVSEACSRLAEYMRTHDNGNHADLLLHAAPATNPYLKKASGGKKKGCGLF